MVSRLLTVEFTEGMHARYARDIMILACMHAQNPNG
jgi:hypothetical protein